MSLPEYGKAFYMQGKLELLLPMEEGVLLLRFRLFALAFWGRGQVNLIPNGDFEEYIHCPNAGGQIDSCLFWINPRPNNGNSGSDLIFAIREDKQRLSRIKARRGLRLLAGLRVRGQKTKSNFRRKLGVVGVTKKSVMPGKAAPKTAATKAPAAKAGKK